MQGPLRMHPPAEDNYGTDACAILCLRTVPSMLVVATSSGKLYHCVLLHAEDADDTQVGRPTTRGRQLYFSPSKSTQKTGLSVTSVSLET